MHLVFIHGWGFDAGVWDSVAAALPQFPQHRVDLGFFGAARDDVPDNEPCILIGHSLGFVHGMKMNRAWAGWVAINSFPRFVATAAQPGCVPNAVVAQMKRNLQRDPRKILADFYAMIGATTAPSLEPHVANLQKGLDELREADITTLIKSTIPGLVLAAAHDPLVPLPISKMLTAQKADLLVQPDGGHMLPQTNPAFCAEAIAAFVTQHFGAP